MSTTDEIPDVDQVSGAGRTQRRALSVGAPQPQIEQAVDPAEVVAEADRAVAGVLESGVPDRGHL
jgi:hypothetical protein